MSQKIRILGGLLIVIVIIAIVLGSDFIRRQTAPQPASAGEVTLMPGSLPIYYQGKIIAGFAPTDLETMQKASFVEPAEGKTEEGWLLRDVLLKYLSEDQLPVNARILVISSSRSKSAELTWDEVANPENGVLFDLSNRGTLKLVSKLEKLDTREEWVQDADRIEVSLP